MLALPEWLISQLGARGALCQDCRAAVAATFWQSLQGPQLCWGCCGRRQADLDDRFARP